VSLTDAETDVKKRNISKDHRLNSTAVGTSNLVLNYWPPYVTSFISFSSSTKAVKTEKL